MLLKALQNLSLLLYLLDSFWHQVHRFHSGHTTRSETRVGGPRVDRQTDPEGAPEVSRKDRRRDPWKTTSGVEGPFRRSRSESDDERKNWYPGDLQGPYPLDRRPGPKKGTRFGSTDDGRTLPWVGTTDGHTDPEPSPSGVWGPHPNPLHVPSRLTCSGDRGGEDKETLGV